MPRSRPGDPGTLWPANAHHTVEKGPLSPTGQTKVNRYLLHEPFVHYTVEDIFNDDLADAFVYAAPARRPRQARGGRCK